MAISVVDAFDLPEWLGTDPVTWQSTAALDSGAHIEGELRGADGKVHTLDVLAVDAAYPSPVCPDAQRTAAHQAWQFGEIALLDVDGRLAASIPGTRCDANLACEAVRRVAKSVGAAGGSFTVAISL